MDMRYFATAADFRAWLADQPTTTRELWVGFHKRHAGHAGMTYPEAVDEALCHGWIDGVRKRLDGSSYTIRFTPRQPHSIWSTVNIQRVGELTQLGQMRPAGLAAFEARDVAKARQYSYEAEARALADPYVEAFQANAGAWAYFQAQAPSYQKTASWWIMSAKREETRLKRLATLIGDSTQGRRLAHLVRTPKA